MSGLSYIKVSLEVKIVWQSWIPSQFGISWTWTMPRYPMAKCLAHDEKRAGIGKLTRCVHDNQFRTFWRRTMLQSNRYPPTDNTSAGLLRSLSQRGFMKNMKRIDATMNLLKSLCDHKVIGSPLLGKESILTMQIYWMHLSDEDTTSMAKVTRQYPNATNYEPVCWFYISRAGIVSFHE